MDRLGPELIAQVLLHANLPPLDLCNLSVLSRDWREAVMSPELWRQMHLSVPLYDEAQLLRVSRHCSQLHELYLSRCPYHPRGLSLAFSSPWLYGVSHVLSRCGDSLRRIVVGTGCNIYHKDYRSGPFYMQLMRRVARHCRNLEVCDLYYNAGRTGRRSDVPLWIDDFIRRCPRIKQFVFWAPSGDCGGLNNAALATMACSWEAIERLELAGESITIDGIANLRRLRNLRHLSLSHVTLGPQNSSTSPRLKTRIEDDDDDDDSRMLTSGSPVHRRSFASMPCSSSTLRPWTSRLEFLQLSHSRCDLEDIGILRRLFPGLKEIRICEVPTPVPFDPDDGDMAEIDVDAHRLRLEEIREACRESPELETLVKLINVV